MAAVGLLAAGTTGCQHQTTMDRQLVLTTLDDALLELDRLAGAPALVGTAVWSWPQTLVHCAQSVEYSMTGFPQAKSALFQRTVGAAALGVFAWRGRMTHDLADPIPGAPALDGASDAPAALARLRQAIAAFQASSASFRPHFAYGHLDKAAYEQAHAMHLANHLSGFDAQS